MTHMPYMFWKNSLTEQRIKNITENGKSLLISNASTFSGNTDIRRSKTGWFNDPELDKFLYGYVREANRHWGYDVTDLCEVQYTIYEGENKGHYGWHNDVDWYTELAVQRKISITVQLSHENEYTGGDFEIQGANMPDNYKTRGSVIVFPSFHGHRVTPVTSGTRKSLVAWFEGPSWR